MKAISHDLIKKHYCYYYYVSVSGNESYTINMNNQPNPTKYKHYIIVNEIFEVKKKATAIYYNSFLSPLDLLLIMW